jgi:hypothetical protein
MGYILFMFTHSAHSQRARTRARVLAWLRHSLIFLRFLFKFGGHILQMTTSYMGYILVMFSHRGHTPSWLTVCLSIDGFSSNLGWTYYTSQQVARATYFSCSRTAHSCEHACANASVLKQSIIFGQILFKFDGHILQLTTSYMRYIRIMFNHCVHAYVCERACASASVIKRSLIFERILFEFGGDIKQIPIDITH